MATQGERRALLFLAAVALLGAAVRACRSRNVSVDASPLDKQIAAVEGTRDGPGDPDSARGKRSRKRIESRFSSTDSQAPKPDSRIDIDMATAGEIEKLPGIGPALARRIIKNREEKGPFGCLAALDRVKGIGPALLAKLDSLATFSAAAGAPCASTARPPAE